MGLLKITKVRMALAVGAACVSLPVFALPQLGGLFAPSLETCLERNDYACAVRSGYWHFFDRAQEVISSPDHENPHGWYLVGNTLAGIGEIDLAREIYDSYPRPYDRSRLGGAIIARLAFDEDYDQLADFFASIQSPTALGLAMEKTQGRLNHAPYAAQLRARDMFIAEVKARIDADGIGPFVEIEELMLLGSPRQHIAVTEWPRTVFMSPDTIWALEVFLQIEDPDIRDLAIRNMDPLVQMMLEQYSTPEGRARLEEREAEIIAFEAERLQQPPEPEGWREPWASTADKIAELTFSTEAMEYQRGQGRPFSLVLLNEFILTTINLIADEDSAALEALADSVSVKGCRHAMLTALAQAHARRGDMDRARGLLDKVLSDDPVFEAPYACRYGEELPVRTLAALLGNDTALQPYFADVERRDEADRPFSVSHALNPIDYSVVFVGVEDTVSHARRIEVLTDILDFTNSKARDIDGQAEDFALASLMDVHDPDMWLHLAREALRQTENASPRAAEKRRARLMEFLSMNRSIDEYWHKFE